VGYQQFPDDVGIPFGTGDGLPTWFSMQVWQGFSCPVSVNEGKAAIMKL
jgi:hypothetical protein